MTPNESYDILYRNRYGKSYKFLKNFKSHTNVDQISREIDLYICGSDFDTDLEKVTQYFYLKYFDNFKTYNYADIIKNIITINSKQYEHIVKNKFSIHYKRNEVETLSDIFSNKNVTYRTVQANLSSKKTHIRELVLYYKCMKSIKIGEFDQIDTFHFILLYKVIKKLILEKKIQTINAVRILPRYYGHLPDIVNRVAKDGDIYYSDGGSNFPSITSIFSNTVHLQCQSEIPDLEFGTIPVLSSPMVFFSNLDESINKFVKLPFSYFPSSISNGDAVIDDEYLSFGKFENDNCTIEGIFNGIRNMVLNLDEMNMESL
jgi:hypothetical protein